MLNTIRRLIGDTEKQEERYESMFDDMVIYNDKNEIDKKNDCNDLGKNSSYMYEDKGKEVGAFDDTLH